MTATTTQPTANKTDAGNGSKAICRVSSVLRSPSPDPRRYAKMNRRTTISALLGAFLIAVLPGCNSGRSDGLDRNGLYHFGIWCFEGGDVKASREWLKSRDHPLYHFGIWCFEGGDVKKSREWLKYRDHPLYHFGIWCFEGGDVKASRDWLQK